ncbi:MAG: YggU family protein [Gemmatimonadetes bacterium]|nr:YggU family protein [Gemmatimonadota bacterium]
MAGRHHGVDLHVQPRASRTVVVGRHGDAIKIRVKAPPVDGAANEELIRFLAKRCGVPRRSVRLVSGASSRHKRITIDGMTPEEITRSLLDDA